MLEEILRLYGDNTYLAGYEAHMRGFDRDDLPSSVRSSVAGTTTWVIGWQASERDTQERDSE